VSEPPTRSRIAQRRTAAIAEGGEAYTAKRAKLIEAAAQVFREKGYTTATINDIAERFGTDRATLYYYVGGKEQLLIECVSEVLDSNLEQGRRIVAGDGTVREKLTALIEITLRSYQDAYPYAYVYIQEDMTHIGSNSTAWAEKLVEKTRAFERLVFDLIEQGVADGSFRADLASSLVANALFGMMNWTHRWFVPGRRYDAQQLADVFLAVLFEGISTD
jgi:AcrR family transcriptional regulator